MSTDQNQKSEPGFRRTHQGGKRCQCHHECQAENFELCAVKGRQPRRCPRSVFDISMLSLSACVLTVTAIVWCMSCINRWR